MATKTIGVLLHETDAGFDTSDYLLRKMLPLWRGMGYGVEMFHGLDRTAPVDVLFPHIDLTVVPEPYRRFCEPHPTVNRTVADISKSRISSNIVREGDAWTGPVLVKTDLNYGGIPEKRLRLLTGEAAPATPQAPGATPATIDWSAIRYFTAGSYPAFRTLADVPPAVFRNPNLIVEKFLPERDGDYYCLRYCYFVGDIEISTLMRSKSLVIKGSQSLSCEEVATPPGIRPMRERMGFEYGKFDYVMRDGQPVVFDASRTPAISGLNVHAHMMQIIPRLAEGIHSLLDRTR